MTRAQSPKNDKAQKSVGEREKGEPKKRRNEAAIRKEEREREKGALGGAAEQMILILTARPNDAKKSP